MPVITEVRLSQLDDRMDANFHATKLKIETMLKEGKISFLPMGELCIFPKARTPRRIEYTPSGIPALKLKNITNSFINWNDIDFIPKRLYKNFFHPRMKDVLITATGEGTIGRANIYEEKRECIVTGEIIVARPKPNKINPYYLLTYLRSKFGRPQLIRFARGATGQTHLYSKDVKRIPVPIQSNSLQEKMEELLTRALEKNNLAMRKYEQLHQFLYTQLGLEVSSEEIAYRKTYEIDFSEIDKSLRYDAEYHQPKYSTLSKLSKLHSKSLHSISDVISGSYISEYVQKGTLYLRVKNIEELGLEFADVKFVNVERSKIPNKIRVKENDVLLTRTGSTGIAVVAPKSVEGAVISQHLTRIILRKGYNPFYVALFLNSVLGRLQTERPLAGSLQKELTHEGTNSVRIPILPEGIQKKMEDEFRKISQLRSESKNLVEQTILEVETFLQ